MARKERGDVGKREECCQSDEGLSRKERRRRGRKEGKTGGGEGRIGHRTYVCRSGGEGDGGRRGWMERC